MTNQKDPVPLLPPKLLSFQQPAGEVHITAVDKAGKANVVACPGQENKVSSKSISLAQSNNIDSTFIRTVLTATVCWTQAFPTMKVPTSMVSPSVLTLAPHKGRVN